MNARRMLRSDYACQYRAVDSPVHRLPSGWKMLISAALSVGIVVVREPVPLLILTVLCFSYYFLARLTLADLWRDIRFFLIQFCILMSLFLYKYGYPAGVWPGVRTSLQITLFFIPGIVFLRTTQVSAMMKGLRRIVPYRILFLLFTSLRFVPFFAREMQEIIMAQKLRGARLAPQDIRRPVFWKDLFSCIIIPMLVRAFRTADEAALSAQARGMGAHADRSYYDVRELEKYISGRNRAAVAGGEAAVERINLKKALSRKAAKEAEENQELVK